MSGKRLFDLCIAVPLFIVTLPVQIAIAFGILLTMGRPVFFLQERPGLHGKPFTIIKFRTMRPQGNRTAHETARITQFGSWLRRSSLDELPELINVLKGDMSVVGPRPLLLEYLPLYSNRQARRHIIKPGLTGMAQVSGRNQLTWEEKFEHDLWYADHQSLSLDLKIILKTIPAFFIWRNIDQSNAETMEPFRGNGACSNGADLPLQRPAMQFVDLKTQYELLHGSINKRIQAVLDHGQYILGSEVAELEAALAEYVGANHCVAVSSGTDALLMALMALGVEPEDEVITTPFTFFATGGMIALLKAKPVLVDIDRRTYNIDPVLLETAITPRTKAILPVSLYGQCADYDAINEIAARHGVPVIEDGAQSFGATYKGLRSCGLTYIAATSFFPSKPLGCYGDGGALFTDDEALAERFQELRVHGQAGRYNHPRIGINGRMDSLQAAILLAKLEIFDAEVAARARLGARYSELIEAGFSDVDTPTPVTTPYVEAHNTSVYAQYTVEVPNRDAVQAAMTERSIPTAVHYPRPLHLQPAFADLDQGPGSFRAAEEAAERVISLPMHAYLTDEQQLTVIHALKDSVLEVL